MLRRKFIQTMLIASSASAMALIGSTARASGGASGGGDSDNGASRSSGGASVNSGGASQSSGGASRSSGGASINSGGASVNRDGTGASLYCDVNGNCVQETYDGLNTVTDNDLDDLLQSFQ